MRHLKFGFMAVLTLGSIAEASAQSTVTINPAAIGPVITNHILGMNMASFWPSAQAGLATALAGAGITGARWPGGIAADMYHWRTNTTCDGEYVSPKATFAEFMNSVATPANLDVAVTVNYGSNATCNGGGDPKEAADWVAYAKTHNENVTHWTVGNEVYGGWGYDLHKKPFDPVTYANAVKTGFYPAMKAANPNAQIGIVVASEYNPSWDRVVLSQAKYDFVETHYYPQAPFTETDSYLISAAPQSFTSWIGLLKSELAAAGHPATPIYLGEIASVVAHPGVQSTSITQALFAGQALGEMMNDGLARSDWWMGFGICTDNTEANFSSSLYGWQNFGGYMVFSDNIPEYGCPNATRVPLGTPMPTARAFQLASLVVHDGEHVLGTNIQDSTGNLRAYAATQSGGTAVMLFNLNQTTGLPVTIGVTGVSSSSAVTVDLYDRDLYDQSKYNVWSPSIEAGFGAQNLPYALTLPPWSMTVVRLAP